MLSSETDFVIQSFFPEEIEEVSDTIEEIQIKQYMPPKPDEEEDTLNNNIEEEEFEEDSKIDFGSLRMSFGKGEFGLPNL